MIRLIRYLSAGIILVFQALLQATGRILRWCRHNHDFLNAISTAAATAIATAGLIVPIGGFNSQRLQNEIVQQQLSLQREQDVKQAQHYSETRRTELAEIIFNEHSHNTMKRYAVQEIIKLDRWRGIMTRDDNREKRWKEEAQKPASLEKNET